jgi:hypothetical protein
MKKNENKYHKKNQEKNIFKMCTNKKKKLSTDKIFNR